MRSGVLPQASTSLALSLLVSGCTMSRPVADLTPPMEPGLPEPVAAFTVSSSRPGYVVDCMGTLVHANWMLTAAHCFSESSPSAWVFIRDVGSSTRVRDVVLHPGAVALDDFEPGGYTNADIVAAYDLALIPIEYAVPAERVASVWLPSAEEGESEAEQLFDAPLVYGRHVGGEAFTASAAMQGLIDASQLLGEHQTGLLLSAWGPVPQSGDSGGGAFVGESTGQEHVLIGVVQNAPFGEAYGRFGLVPTWLPEPANFILEVAIDPTQP